MKSLPVLSLSFLLSACSYSSSLGITQGGAQDMELARSIIHNGGIPDAEAFTAEGLFSEFNLPMSGPVCEENLCPRTALARSIDLHDQTHLLVQLGFATQITAENHQRRPQNLSAAVDISGSMTGEKLEMVKQALSLMVDQLTEDDRLSLVTYGSFARVKKRSLTMNEYGKRVMKLAINSLKPRGSTNMEKGMVLSYDLVADRIDETDMDHRVMLFTDAQPNVGSTDTGSFLGLAQSYAAQGIGLSVFGVGLDLGAELANAVSETRGGNSFFLSGDEVVEQLFSEEFSFLVSPIAYDLQVSVNLAEEVALVKTYATPTDDIGNELQFGASTLFLSRRDGGMGALLRADDITGKLGSMDIQYENLRGETIEQSVHLQFFGDALVSSSVNADDVGVFTMAHLIHEIDALQAGADFCEGLIEAQEAIELIETAEQRLSEAAGLLDSDQVSAEAELMSLLKENVEVGTEACVWSDVYAYIY